VLRKLNSIAIEKEFGEERNHICLDVSAVMHGSVIKSPQNLVPLAHDLVGQQFGLDSTR
jgi:hypothetical protein